MFALYLKTSGPHSDKEVQGEVWEPKTKKNRAVPISSRLRHYLDKWRLNAQKGKGAWLFPSPVGKRWDPDNFSQDLRATNHDTNLPWGCLDFRHTFGSHLAMKGESLLQDQQTNGQFAGDLQSALRSAHSRRNGRFSRIRNKGGIGAANRSYDPTAQFDREAYRGRCVAEHCVGWLKEFRHIGTSFEKLAVNFHGMLQLAVIIRYLRLLF